MKSSRAISSLNMFARLSSWQSTTDLCAGVHNKERRRSAQTVRRQARADVPPRAMSGSGQIIVPETIQKPNSWLIHTVHVHLAKLPERSCYRAIYIHFVSIYQASETSNCDLATPNQFQILNLCYKGRSEMANWCWKWMATFELCLSDNNVKKRFHIGHGSINAQLAANIQK